MSLTFADSRHLIGFKFAKQTRFLLLGIIEFNFFVRLETYQCSFNHSLLYSNLKFLPRNKIQGFLAHSSSTPMAPTEPNEQCMRQSVTATQNPTQRNGLHSSFLHQQGVECDINPVGFGCHFPVAYQPSQTSIHFRCWKERPSYGFGVPGVVDTTEPTTTPRVVDTR